MIIMLSGKDKTRLSKELIKLGYCTKSITKAKQFKDIDSTDFYTYLDCIIINNREMLQDIQVKELLLEHLV